MKYNKITKKEDNSYKAKNVKINNSKLNKSHLNRFLKAKNKSQNKIVYNKGYKIKKT